MCLISIRLQINRSQAHPFRRGPDVQAGANRTSPSICSRTAAGSFLCHGGSVALESSSSCCCAVHAVVLLLLPCCCCAVARLLLCCCPAGALVLCCCLAGALRLLCCMLHPSTFENVVLAGGTETFFSEACMQVPTQPSCQLTCTVLVSAHMHCCPTSASPKASEPKPCTP